MQKMEAALSKRRRKVLKKASKRRHSPALRVMRVWDAAKYLGIPESTLNQLRTYGGGPPFSKIGRSILYEVHDLDAWLQAKKYKSTADYATAR